MFCALAFPAGLLPVKHITVLHCSTSMPQAQLGGVCLLLLVLQLPQSRACPPYQGCAALPSARSVRIRLPISTAVTAASPPLLPTLPPARSSACGGREGGRG